MKKSLVFLLALFVAFIGQGFIWTHFEYVDKSMWVDQARFIATRDPQAFNKLVAYGHPGTVAVEIAIIAHKLFGVSYTAASNGSLTVLNSLVIAVIITLCYELRPQNMWYVVVGGLLIFNRLFPASTPPTAAASPLIVLLFLVTLWLYENTKNIRSWQLVFWGIVAGLSASSRTDITGVVALPLLLFMFPRLGSKKVALMVASAALTFYITDPFMWARPLGHMYDLVAETHLHYANFTPSHLTLPAVLLISPLAILSIGFALVFLFGKKKLPHVLAPKFIIMMLVLTVGIGTILLTAKFQAQRYFFPLVMLWETFLPLFLLELLSYITFSFLPSGDKQVRARRLAKIAVVTLLVGGQVTMLIHLFFIPQVIFVCPPTANRWIFCVVATPMVW